jgi:hypothetical protein
MAPFQGQKELPVNNDAMRGIMPRTAAVLQGKSYERANSISW